MYRAILDQAGRVLELTQPQVPFNVQQLAQQGHLIALDGMLVVSCSVPRGSR